MSEAGAPAAQMAPAWQIAEWLNTQQPVTLESLRGKVVLAVAFQMLCPGCVSHALPQAQRVRAMFPESELAVIGLHCVFEHHEAQGGRAPLAAFLHEYRIGFPVGVDAHAPGDPLPLTMRAYQMRGTPTTLVIDRTGRLRAQRFGHVDDIALGAQLGALMVEPTGGGGVDEQGCGPDGCEV